MASKYLFLAVVATVAVSLVRADDCDCKDRGESKELWDYFSKLSRDIDNLDEEEKNLHSVLPGLLSPLFECNCLDKARRKRQISPEEYASIESHSDSDEAKLERVRSLRQRKSIRFGSRTCPKGFAKVGYLCIKEEYLD